VSRTVSHPVNRLTVPLGRPYDEVIAQFEDLVPVVPLDRFRRLDAWDAVAGLAGDAVFVIDQPSTLFSSYGREAIALVGRELDRLVAGLLRALDADPPRELIGHSD
jgi:hypothetical protein